MVPSAGFRTAPLAFALAAMVFSFRGAHADIPPPDSCGTIGEACQNGVDGGATRLSGTCQASQCTRTTPAGPITYACNRCIPSASQGGSCSCAVPGRADPTHSAYLTLVALALVCARARRRAAR